MKVLQGVALQVKIHNKGGKGGFVSAPPLQRMARIGYIDCDRLHPYKGRRRREVLTTLDFPLQMWARRKVFYNSLLTKGDKIFRTNFQCYNNSKVNRKLSVLKHILKNACIIKNFLYYEYVGFVAQLVEQQTLNLFVGGSIPPGPTSFLVHLSLF